MNPRWPNTDEEVEILRTIIDLRAKNRHPRKAFREISRYLEKMKMKNRLGKPFSPQAIHHIVKQQALRALEGLTKDELREGL